MFLAGRNIPVPGNYRDFQLFAQATQAIPLIVNQRFEGADIKHRARYIGVIEQVGQDWEESRLGFTRCGGCSNNDVLIGVDQSGNSLLLGIPERRPAFVPDPALNPQVKQAERAGVRVRRWQVHRPAPRSGQMRHRCPWPLQRYQSIRASPYPGSAQEWPAG